MVAAGFLLLAGSLLVARDLGREFLPQGMLLTLFIVPSIYLIVLIVNDVK